MQEDKNTIIDEKKKETLIYIRCSRDDKDFLITSRELKEYLVFKYKMIPDTQEDFMRLVVLELRESLAKK